MSSPWPVTCRIAPARRDARVRFTKGQSRVLTGGQAPPHRRSESQKAPVTRPAAAAAVPLKKKSFRSAHFNSRSFLSRSL